MLVKFLGPMMVTTDTGVQSFGVGDVADLADSLALQLHAQGRVRIPNLEFQLYERVKARKVSKFGRRTDQFHKPRWVIGTIIAIEPVFGRARISGDGEEFWSSLSTIRKF